MWLMITLKAWPFTTANFSFIEFFIKVGVGFSGIRTSFAWFANSGSWRSKFNILTNLLFLMSYNLLGLNLMQLPNSFSSSYWIRAVVMSTSLNFPLFFCNNSMNDCFGVSAGRITSSSSFLYDGGASIVISWRVVCIAAPEVLSSLSSCECLIDPSPRITHSSWFVSLSIIFVAFCLEFVPALLKMALFSDIT